MLQKFVTSIEKVLEVVLKKQFVEHSELNNCLTRVQSEFREKYSCEAVINTILDNWLAEVEDNNIVVRDGYSQALLC